MTGGLRRGIGEQGGFTLVELVVASAAAVVVMFGACSLVIMALHTTSRVSDRVEAAQTSRTAMEQLVQELSSGCLVNDVSPVQATTATGITPVVNSDGRDLVFVSGLGDSANITPTEHVISVQSGALVDTAYSNTGGSPPALSTPATWTFSSTPSMRRVLVQRVAQINASTPLFQYFSYSNPNNPTANSLDGALPLSATPISASDAASVAQVNIAWEVTPHDGQSDASRLVDMQDSVVFRDTPAGTSGTNYPCD